MSAGTLLAGGAAVVSPAGDLVISGTGRVVLGTAPQQGSVQTGGTRVSAGTLLAGGAAAVSARRGSGDQRDGLRGAGNGAATGERSDGRNPCVGRHAAGRGARRPCRPPGIW